MKSEVITASEAATADHQGTPIADHFAEYLIALGTKDVSAKYLTDIKRAANRLTRDCQFDGLSDISLHPVEL